jgi:hypothetical protein
MVPIRSPVAGSLVNASVHVRLLDLRIAAR